MAALLLPVLTWGPWQTILGTLWGDDRFHEFDDTTASGPQGYYRLLGAVY